MGASGAGTGLLILLVTLVVALVGLWQYQQGRAQRSEAVRRARLDKGQAAGRRVRAAVEARLRRTGFGQRLELRLTTAGVAVQPADFLLLVATAAVAGYVVSGVLLPPVLQVLAALGAARGCYAWIERKRAQRREAFVAQLPDLARILSSASSAGLAMTSAIRLASSELDQPAAAEMERVHGELRIGHAVAGALANLQERMPSREVGVLVTTLVIQQRAGGDLVSALREMAETLESRRQLRREVKTTMSGVLFTSYIVGALGLGSLLLLNVISPGVIDQMTGTVVGRVALLIAAVAYTVGYVLIRNTTRIPT